jgi:excisionase family DNA binding protein
VPANKPCIHQTCYLGFVGEYLVMANNNNQILTTGDVMRYCHVSRSTVIKWIKLSKLNAYSHPGGQYRLTRDSLLEFLKEHSMPIDEELMK